MSSPAETRTQTHAPEPGTDPPGGPTGGTGGSLPAPPASPAGTSRYLFDTEIARGGMGVVYRATDTTLGREVAVKVLQDRFAPESGSARRFADEARITGGLQHPGIPPVHDLGTLPDGRPFLAMKLIKGNTLDDLLEARPNPGVDRGRFVAAFEQACQAVAYAHAHGVIHRDLKPANVMVGSFGEVQVMDWGLAKVLAPGGRPADETDPNATTPGTEVQSLRDLDGAVTRAGSVIGTPAFMSPEQAAGAVNKIDARSDVFGLGALLAVVLTGSPPFVGSSAETTRVKAARGDVAECFARLGECGAEPELVALCKRCLSADPAARPADAGEVAAAVAELRQAAEARARQAERAALVQAARADHQRRMRKWQLALGTAVAAVVGAFVVAVREYERAALNHQVEQTRIEGERTAERAAEEARARQAAESAVALAADLREKFRYKDAIQFLDQAAALVPPDAPPEIAQSLAESRADTVLVRDLDEIRFGRIRHDPTAGERELGATYRKAFLSRGYDPSGPDPVAAERVVRSPVRRTIAVALTDWAAFGHSPARQRLLDTAYRADPCDLRDRLRDPRTFTDAGMLQLAELSLVDLPPDQLGQLLQLTRPGWPAGRPRLLAAAARHPSDFWLQFEIGYFFVFKDPDPRRAVEALRAALALRPDCLYAASLLADSLRRAGDYDGAIALGRGRSLLSLKSAPTHNGPGAAPPSKGGVEGEVAALREAIRLDPQYAPHHSDLGAALWSRGDLEGAIAALREAVRLDPQLALSHNRLGIVLGRKGDVDGQIAAYREAIRLDPRLAPAHGGLGAALSSKGDLTGAIKAYTEAARLETDPERGQYARQQVAEVERWLTYQQRLPKLLDGADRPGSSAEALSIAHYCQQPFVRRFQQAFTLYRDTFDSDPRAIGPWQEYRAACAAVQLASGFDSSVVIGTDEWYYLHGVARRWLVKDLGAHRAYAVSANSQTRAIAVRVLPTWLSDPALAPTRDPAWQAAMPANERVAWQQLWADVRATLARARRSPPPVVAPATEGASQ